MGDVTVAVEDFFDLAAENAKKSAVVFRSVKRV